MYNQKKITCVAIVLDKERNDFNYDSIDISLVVDWFLKILYM